jgi:hydroxypyruvate isomerase
MNRRTFLKSCAMVTATTAVARAANPENSKKFALDYAPHFGMFRRSAGEDLVDQLKFAADSGFRAWEDNLMKDRQVVEQHRIAEAMEQLGIRMGVISATRGTSDQPSFTSEDATIRDRIVKQVAEVVEVAKRVRATWMTAVLGDVNPALEPDEQTTLAIELMRRCCDVVEPHGLVLVMEPLNHWSNHPGKFLWKATQARLICRAINRPSCKILYDIYHQQVSEGNLIANIDRCWNDIAYVQAGDNPGRNEPTTGEINYSFVFRHLKERGYRGIVGMEHGNSRKGVEGERAVIEAYRTVDPN